MRDDAVPGPGVFYDDIAAYYDLIYADWEDSMLRHGAAISALLADPDPKPCRILDVAAGIGTQALPLAALGHDVAARDLSPASIHRLRREARTRDLEIDTAVADVRRVADSVAGPFDAIIAFDNAIPHLLTDADIRSTFASLARMLAADGRILISVRDYSAVNRDPTSFHEYGERQRDGRRFRLGQHWSWTGPSHYRTTMLVEERVAGDWHELVRTDAEYYAVPIERLLELMQEAGLIARRVENVPFFQPVLEGLPAT